jgi:hypothetical protein
MASGWTTTGSLADSLDDVRMAARIIREQVGNASKLCDNQTLGEGLGNSWQEISYDQLSAQAITETTELDNPQQIADSLLTITPTVIGIETFITDRVKARINKIGLNQIGQLGQNAMERKKDEDCITLFASGATTAQPGAGATLTSGYIAASAKNISSDATEPGPAPIRCVLHGFQIKDLFDELVAGVGTYVVTDGPTADVFKKGFMLPVAGCEVYEDGNITVDSSDDARGAVFSEKAIVKVQGRASRMVPVRNEKRGGGGEHIYHYDEYAYGERSSGNWLYSMQSDATAPTS